MHSINSNKIAGLLGISAFLFFVLSLAVFGLLNPSFSFLDDYISKLGAIGEPLALWWNIIGFGLVGILFIGFGISYGKVIQDKFSGLLLALFGLGFALTSLPMDMTDDRSPVSKAHIVAICLGLACWLFGLARMSYNPTLSKAIKSGANVAATLLAISMIGQAMGIWPMPVTHRLVFTIVFGWTFITSVSLLRSKPNH